MKKLLPILLAALLLLASGCSWQSAGPDPAPEAEPISGPGGEKLLAVAERTILSSEVTADRGRAITTYSNLQEYVSAAREEVPELNDLELAAVLAQTIQLRADGVPDDELEDLLTYDSVTVSCTYFVENASGITDCTSAPSAEEVASSDSVLRLVTCYTPREEVDGKTYYLVTCQATWLKVPAGSSSEVLVVGTDATFDDSFSESGYVVQEFICSDCQKETKQTSSVSMETPSSENLELLYYGPPYISFYRERPCCQYCGKTAGSAMVTAYLRYGVLVSDADGVKSLCGAYARSAMQMDTVTVRSGSSGTVSFSSKLSTNLKEYHAWALRITEE